MPQVIDRLYKLIKLDLGGNQLRKIPKAITRLSNLTHLYLSRNQITELSEPISRLSNLNYLSLWGNQLIEIPKEISSLHRLKVLDMSGNQIVRIPGEISCLSNLSELSLHKNKINSIDDEFFRLSSLTYLSLSDNELTELPDELSNLSRLNELLLHGNKLPSVPRAIEKLTLLEKLTLSNNKISDIPDSLEALSSLVEFYIHTNQLTVFPGVVKYLPRLKKLDLGRNQIGFLPEWVQKMSQLTSLDLRGNPIPIMPELLGPEERKENPGVLKSILDYYFQIQNSDATERLYEAKFLILGEGGAGKTTLAKKVENSDYQLKKEGSKNPEESTQGIDVIRWEFELPDKRIFRVNIWDFGGQEIYHATHQFFLTKRTLYALVADTRKENTDFYYWLNIVELLSEGSPVFIVKNEKQDRPCEINERQLRGQFKNLEAVIPANLGDPNNRGLTEIKDTIQQYITRLPHVGTPLPKIWVRIRSALENYSSHCNYITLEKYFEICRLNGFPDEQRMLDLSQYLHDLGVCLHFQDDKLLKKTVILRPEWGTTAAYKVLDNKTVQKNLGCFTDEDLADIWSEKQYTQMRDELLQLMMRFKLCYEIPSSPGTYISPQLLSVNEPEHDWEETDNLILRYEYEFMPKGLLSRFIVEMHRLIENQDLVWKTGVILSDGRAHAEVIEYYSQKKIRIRVSGFQKKSLLERVRHEFEKIHDSYGEQLQYQEFIPCNCPKCDGQQNPHAYPLEVLMRFLEDRQYDIQCAKSYNMVNVRRLIDEVMEPLMEEGDYPMDAMQIDEGMMYPEASASRRMAMRSPKGKRSNAPAPESQLLNQPEININIHQSNDRTDMSSNYSQTNTGGVNFQNNISGGQVNQAENITINNNESQYQPKSVDLDDNARTILFLASNPKQTGQLRLSEELREIDESLLRAQRRSQFDLKSKGAVRTRDFTRALLDNNPHIVHFSGHGKDTAAPNDSRSDTRATKRAPESEPEPLQGLLFEDETGHPKLVSSEQLADVFELFADQIECVLLNACHSQNQADAIAQHIPYVIGMSRLISDKGAIEFAIAFYDAIGAGRDIPFAFKLARTQLTPFGEKDIPQLIQKPSR